MKLKDIIVMEAPYLHDEELGYKVLAHISNSALTRAYTHFVKIGDIDIYSNIHGGFIAGYKREDSLSMVVSISTRYDAYPVVPTQLGKYQQISMVNVSSLYAERGNTKLVYTAIANKLDLVSDNEQYLGAQGLWKSLARSSDINVYVFDGRIKDYVRDSSGKIIKYNGKNIDDKEIWGSKDSYRAVLLVGTTKELK